MKPIADWQVAVVGGGAMGAGIAQIAASCKHRTVILEVSADAADAAKQRVESAFERLVKRGRLNNADARATLTRLECVADAARLADADIVIEAVVEDETIKRDLFARMESVCRPDALIASNTSSLSLDALAQGMRRRGRFAGLHFFNPAPQMKLVEIIRGAETDKETIDSLFALARHWQKTPVLARDAPGFIVNRIARPFYGEALRLLEENAATPEETDAALRAAGFRMGAFELMDLIGNDVNYAVTESVWLRMGEDERFAPSALQKQKRDGGQLGRKSGGGFYPYDAEGKAVRRKLTPPAESAAIGEVILRGEHAGLRHLADTAAAAGVSVAEQTGTPAVRIGGRWLVPAEVESAATEPEPWRIDYVADYAAAELFVVSCDGDAKTQSALRAFFAAAQKPLLAMTKPPGMIALRVVATMVNLAVDAENEGLASREDMNAAMRHGVNHPHGPFEWLDVVGEQAVSRTLRQLQKYYGGARYTPAKIGGCCHG